MEAGKWASMIRASADVQLRSLLPLEHRQLTDDGWACSSCTSLSPTASHTNERERAISTKYVAIADDGGPPFSECRLEDGTRIIADLD
jgi:hypothetical protein